ncbi:hypothetical protein ACFS5L_42105 [Streptomyces phyllanthi]|uniref:hypothetical protein n=1 Tax=Streptomyces phyllanthi TaxID=1803180 RepID=UPI002AD45546|nr:hypothetical protein [Streptomyces phyllanthi]
MDRFLGEFRELGHGRPDGPSLRDSVRAEGEAYERDLVRYLRAGSVLAATTSRVHDILSPTKELIDGLRLLTDGEWFWYTDLAHYVGRYHVPVDVRFVDHARRRGWVPPRLSDSELIRLEGTFVPDDYSAPVIDDERPTAPPQG